MNDVRVSGVALGALTLLGFGVFFFGIRDSLRDDRDPRGGPSNNEMQRTRHG